MNYMYRIDLGKEHHYIWHKSIGDMTEPAGAFPGKDVI